MSGSARRPAAEVSVVVIGPAFLVREYVRNRKDSLRAAGTHTGYRFHEVRRMDDAYRLAGLEFDPDDDELVTLDGADELAVEFVKTRFRRPGRRL